MADSFLQTWLAELRRRRVLRAMAGYVLAAWLLLQVANVTFPPLGLPDWWQRALIIALAVGIAPAFIVAWVFDFTRSGIVRTPDAPAAVGEPGQPPAVPAAAAGASVAILPFVDLSPDKDQDWFCDGLSEEIIDALCCVRGLRVAARTASFRYRDGSVDPRQIGRELQVGAILEGSVRKAGDRLRITAQLIDTSNGYHLWSEAFDRQLADVFAIQSEIARKVSASLRVSLAGDELARRERYAPRDLRAHEFYLRGRQLIGSIATREWRQAPAMFRRAIELDSEYAQAHAGLADALAQLMLWRFVRPEEVLPEAARAAYRALELAPDLAEVHVAAGHVRSLTGDSDGAKRSFERALELNPELFEAHYYFARHCHAQGDLERAAELFLSAHALRPDDFTVPALAISLLDRLGRREEANRLVQTTLPGLRHMVELDPDDARAHYFIAGLLARVGRREEGRPHVEAALRLRPDDYSTLYNAACYYSLGGEPERAMDLLERACDLGGGSYDWFLNDGDLDPLRSNPRFAALMARLAAGASPPPRAS